MTSEGDGSGRDIVMCYEMEGVSYRSSEGENASRKRKEKINNNANKY